MSTTETPSMPLVDLEFHFRLDPRIWRGGDKEWSREVSVLARNRLNSLPHAIGIVPHEEEVVAYFWRGLGRDGVDIVYMEIATEAHRKATRHERNGVGGVTYSFGEGLSIYDIADALKDDGVMVSLQSVLEIVLAQGRLHVVS